MATAFKQVKNNASTTIAVAGGLDNTTSPLVFDVDNGGELPSFPGNAFYITAWDNAAYPDRPGDDPNMRIGLCTARLLSTITVIWGQLGTPINPMSGTPTIALLLQDQHLKDIYTAVNTSEDNIQSLQSTIAGLDTAFIHSSLAIAKGDILAATGPSAFTRLAVGANGRVLSADSSQSNGLLWLDLLASPAFTGAPTAPTAASGTNTTQIATTAFTQTAINSLINAAPGALDTLGELASALGNDANFATTIINSLVGKQPLDSTLTGLAGVTTAANKLIYATGTDAFATTDLSPFARSLLDDADFSAALTTLRAQAKISIVVGSHGDTGYITDGVDDQVQINAAALAVHNAGGGIVELPDTSYTLGSNVYIQLYDNVWYRGGGFTQTSVGVAAGFNQTIFGDFRYYLNPSKSGGQLTNCTISDIKIDGTNQAGSSVFAKGVAAFHTLRLTLRNIWCYNTTATGIGPDFNEICLIDSCIAELCGKGDLNPGYNGFGLGTGDTDESVLMVNCFAINNYNGGFLFERQDGTDEFYPREYQLTNCYAISNKNGFRNSGCSNMILNNCISRDNIERGFYHERYTNVTVPKDISMNACYAYNNGATGIEFSADTRCENPILSGCKSWNNGSNGIAVAGINTTVDNCYAWGNKNCGLKIAPTRNQSTGGSDITNLGHSDLIEFRSLNIRGGHYFNNGVNNTNGETEGIRISCGTVALLSGAISGIHCYDNQATATQGYGVGITGSVSNLTLDGGFEIYGNGFTGVYCSINNASVSNLKFLNGTTWNNSRNGLVAPNQRGIHINGDVTLSGFISHLLVRNIRAYDDQISKTQQYGISISGNVSNADVSDNNVIGNGTAGIYYNPAAPDLTNIFLNNKGYNSNESYSLGNISGSTTFNRLNGRTQYGTLTGNVTAILTAGVNDGDMLVLIPTQDATGSRTITWPSNVVGGPILSTAANAVDVIMLSWDSINAKWRKLGGSIGVTSISVVSTNGFSGSVANSTTTPAITLSTTIAGLLKGNGTAISAAAAGTDYLAPSAIGSTLQAWDADLDALAALSTLGVLKRTGSGAFSTLTTPSGALVGDTDSQTLSAKRISPRVTSTASSATPSPSYDTDDQYEVTALAVDAVFGAPTGTPVNGQKIVIRIKDNGTARALAYNATYRAIGITLPLITVISKTLYLGGIYNGTDSKLDILAVAQES